MADNQASGTQAPAAATSTAWENRPIEELRALIGRGLAGGDEVALAIAETERRARASHVADLPAKPASPYSAPSFRRLVIVTAVTILAALAIGLWLAT